MFTGIVTALGRLIQARPSDGGARIRVAASDLPGEDLVLGESIAVQGVCLTVAAVMEGRAFEADISGETLRLTTLAGLLAGSDLNLERAMRAGDRLGGHIVSGHVDGVGILLAVEPDGLSNIYRFQVPSAFSRYLAVKGSVAVDGVSLTINQVEHDGFAVNLIPHTLAHTTLGRLQPGDRVNLEVDQVARYVERLMAFQAR
ncbi:MAG: riboflavin synthase [Xanthomonadales bacterium]|nr:riboflavin synthase [Xanthomonadales bacterium]